MNVIELIQPDDWHIHLREGKYLERTVPDAARQFARAIVMPNLSPPVLKVSTAEDYYHHIMDHCPLHSDFKPLMTLYLANSTTVSDIEQAQASPFVYACKLYPKNSTTHAQQGVSNIKHMYPVLAAMEACCIPLLIHAESTQEDIDIFDRESHFIEQQLSPLVQKFPKLKIVVEHITTEEAVKFVTNAPDTVAATITAHHLMYNRNRLLVRGIHPHYYCLPILKKSSDQKALIQAAISGNPKFFIGTDSAPPSYLW